MYVDSKEEVKDDFEVLRLEKKYINKNWSGGIGEKFIVVFVEFKVMRIFWRCVGKMESEFNKNNA